MIFGRPTNLWLGLTTAVSGAIAASLIALGTDPAIVGTLAGVWQGVLGAAILLIANQPPTLSPGDSFTVKTAGAAPNYTTVVAHPPAQDAPPVVKEDLGNG